MKIFYFPKCEWKYLLFLLFFIFSFLQNFVNRWISMNSKDVAQPLINIYFFNISDFFSIIPLIILEIRTRRLNKKEASEKIAKLIEANTIKKTKKKNFIYLLILVSFFDCLAHISSIIFYFFYGKNERSVSENNLSSLLIFNIITIYLLSRLVLKTYFYRHHYFSFLMNIICIIILSTLDLVNINKDKNGESVGMIVFYIIKKIFTFIFYSVEYVFGKKVLLQKFKSIYTLLLYRAIFGSLFIILFSIPLFFIEVTDKTTKDEETGIIFSRFSKLFYAVNAFKIILFAVSNFFYNIFIWLIIDKFSPSHYVISQIFESFGTLIRLWIVEPNKTDLPVLRMFIFFILIFSSLIYTEMIVINFCGLQKYTKIFLDDLEKVDIQQIFNDSTSGPSSERVTLNESLDINEEHNNDNEYIKNNKIIELI